MGSRSSSWEIRSGSRTRRSRSSSITDPRTARPHSRVAVALSRLASDDDVSGGFDPATISSKVRKLVEDFFRNPNTETLRAFAGARTHLVGEQFTYLLRDANAKTNVFYALFSAKPEGNGVKKWDAGRCAAREAWQLFHYELVDVAVETRRLDEMFAGKDKVARANAAFLLGRVHFERGDPSAGIAMFESGDAAVRLALLDAFWTTVVAARMDKRSIRPAEKFAPMLAAGLRGRPDQRTRALQAIQQIAIHLRADLSSVLTPVIEVLDSGKPAQIEYALRILAHHACWIMHALVPYDARIGGSIAAIIEHSKPVKGKLKVTKVQIAARYALSAYEKLGKHFDAEQRDAVERAFAAIAHVR
jgi:hypothetical protein